MWVRLVALALLASWGVGCDGSESNWNPNTNTGEGALRVWTQSTRTKVQPTTLPTSSTTVQLAGPRKSYQAYQIVVTAEEGGLLGVEASASDLTDGQGNQIAASHLTLFRQWPIDFAGATSAVGGTEPVPEHSPSGDTRIPDPLIPLIHPVAGGPLGQPFQVADGLSQALWLDVYIPAGTPAGPYTGNLSLIDQAGQTAEVSITLDVWDLDLPDMTAVTTWFIFRIDPLVEYHSDTEDCYPDACWLDWTERSRTIVKRYEELAHRHRIDTGQHFVHAPVDGCNPPTDFSTYDEDIAPYMDGSTFEDGVPSTRLSLGFSPGTMEWGWGAGCSEQDYAALAGAWATHLRDRGWFDRSYIYALDE
ncbi:MAG: hypothetical protein JRI68_01040, partial [Deltaproteobacteria bacterium]|nr:hypothetical protein [Deltaproteobacteria bacterium]